MEALVPTAPHSSEQISLHCPEYETIKKSSLTLFFYTPPGVRRTHRKKGEKESKSTDGKKTKPTEDDKRDRILR